MTLVRLEPAAPRSRVKHSTTEPLRSHFLHLLQLGAAMALLRLHGYRDSSEPLLFSGATSTKISCNGSSMQVFDENLFFFCVLVLYIPVSIFSVML